MARLSEDLKSFSKNPPSFFSVIGGYNVIAHGAAFVGVLASATKMPDYMGWKYWVHTAEVGNGALSNRVEVFKGIFDIPTEADQGFLKSKADFGQIRALDAPTADPGKSTVVWNKSTVLDHMVKRRLNGLSQKEVDAIDLNGGIQCVVIDPRKDRDTILEWVDCLYSVISGDAAPTEDDPDNVEQRIFFLPNKNRTDAIIQSLENVSISPTGKIDADPMAIALAFSVGRTEWLAQREELPVQAYAKRMKKLIRERGGVLKNG